jgi:hypothetical protein
MGRACSTHAGKKNALRMLVGKSEGNRPLGRPRHRWVDNFKMGLRDVGLGGLERIDLLQDMDQWRTFGNAVMNLWVPQNFGNFMSECTTGGFSRRAQLHRVSE